MKIVQIAAECAPFAKVGGLADVIAGLSRELVTRGHSVTIILPKYGCLNSHLLPDLAMDPEEFSCEEDGVEVPNRIWRAKQGGCDLILLDPFRHPAGYFTRSSIYGFEDDAARFLYFSKCALQFIVSHKLQPDLLHFHEWHTSAIPVMLRRWFQPIPNLLTIHNLEYQGTVSARDWERIGLKNEGERLLETGIITSDQVTVVSPTYLKEALEPKGGFGLGPVLQKQKKKLNGIVNGLDQHFWNPEKDPHLAYSYTPQQTIQTILQAKLENKRALQKKLGLEIDSAPLIASIGRLVSQKGPELLTVGARHTLHRGGQFVLLGSAANSDIQEKFELLQNELRSTRRAYFYFQYDELLSHLLYAAADFFLIPSRTEPCGLTQLIAMKYGTLPIARKTGGLADTVFDLEADIPEKQKNGITFEAYAAADLQDAIDRALRLWQNNSPLLHSTIKHAMHLDHSWEKPTLAYEAIYAKGIKQKKPAASK